jgi:alkyldihydroxyacetonephosphate synthase
VGHFPQSFEYSTLGGWIATRSSGQQSYYYGRIEDLFAGGEIYTPVGKLTIHPTPASAAGPDLRQIILGSEGRYGIITQATVRVTTLPQTEDFYAIFFHDWASGVKAVREMVQACVRVSMLRLSDAQETETTLTLSGREKATAFLDRSLRFIKYGSERCMLLYGVTGSRSTTRHARRQVSTISRRHGGLGLGSIIGKAWRKGRFYTAYLRNTLWERGYAVDTLETAVPWSAVIETAEAIKEAIRNGLASSNEQVLVFSHLSHFYPDGASIYVTYLFRRAVDPDETLDRWQTLKKAASQVIVKKGGTISHQHGVGKDHMPYLEAEKDKIGMAWLEAIGRSIDPDDLMNQGTLFDQNHGEDRLDLKEPEAS